MAESQIKSEKIKNSYLAWKENTPTNIQLSKCDDNKLFFDWKIDENTNVSFTITHPKTRNALLEVSTCENIPMNYKWLSDLNEYIKKEKPTFGRLLRHVDKKFKESKNVPNISTLLDNKVMSITDLLSNDDEEVLMNFDINEMRLERDLKQNLPNMKSTMDLDGNTSKAALIFKGTSPGQILIKQYMGIRRKYMNDSRIEISLVNNNIFKWNLKLRSDPNNDLTKIKEKFGYDYIQVEINFHDKFYPCYPPFLRVVRPRLMDSLMHRITNLTMVQFDYWTPSREIEYVVSKLVSILNEHAKIDVDNEMNDITNYPNGAYHVLEETLIKLSSLYDSGTSKEQKTKDEKREPLDKTEYKLVTVKAKTNDKSKNTYGNNGIGYGGDGGTKWSEDYARIQGEKDMQIQCLIKKIIDDMEASQVSLTPEKMLEIYKIIEASFLIPFIKSQIDGMTILEMGKHIELYKLLFNLLQMFATEEAVFLFDDMHSNDNLYDLIKKLNQEVELINKLENEVKTSETTDDAKKPTKKVFTEKELEGMSEEEMIAKALAANESEQDLVIGNIVQTLYEMITPIYTSYIEKMKELREQRKKMLLESRKQVDTTDNTKPEYIQYYKAMFNEVYGNLKIENYDTFRLSERAKTKKVQTTMTKESSRRVVKEIASWIHEENKKGAFPVHFFASILVRVDEKNMRCMRVMMTGPPDTPYDNGVFIFDLYITDNYPENSPSLVFLNNGGKRYNPNLYADGKVCLSLLGTWNGPAWDVKSSTIFQLLASVQSQILIPDPYFNEPGHESSYGTDGGKEQSKIYNNHIRYFVMCYSILAVLKNPNTYPEFESAIKKHFAIKKDYILATCDKWVKESFKSDKTAQESGTVTPEMYLEKYNEIKDLLNKLEPVQ